MTPTNKHAESPAASPCFHHLPTTLNKQGADSTLLSTVGVMVAASQGSDPVPSERPDLQITSRPST